MRTVFLVGAGASYFAGLPLAMTLIPFLKRDLDNSRDHIVRDSGWRFFEFIETIKPVLPDRWKLENGEPDLEFVLSLVDKIEQNVRCETPELNNLCGDLDDLIREIDLAKIDLSQVKQCFATLVTSAFQNRSYDILCKIRDEPDNYVSHVSEAWANRVSDGDVIISFNWDLLHEILLWKAKKWTYYNGYGIQCDEDMTLDPSPTIMLKLHGSCNWALRHRQDQTLRLDYINIFF